MITLPIRLVQESKQLGLNISKLTENALMSYLARLEQGFSIQNEVVTSPDVQPSWARSLVRTRTLRGKPLRTPAEPEIRGSNPRGPAMTPILGEAGFGIREFLGREQFCLDEFLDCQV